MVVVAADQYDRLTGEARKDSGNNLLYANTYGYDSVGNRTSATLGGACPERSRGDLNGNMTSVTGNLLSNWTLAYNDENQLNRRPRRGHGHLHLRRRGPVHLG